MVAIQLGVSPAEALVALRARSFAEGRQVGVLSAEVVTRRASFDPGTPLAARDARP
jgi:hypothetical protein